MPKMGEAWFLSEKQLWLCDFVILRLARRIQGARDGCFRSGCILQPGRGVAGFSPLCQARTFCRADVYP